MGGIIPRFGWYDVRYQRLTRVAWSPVWAHNGIVIGARKRVWWGAENESVGMFGSSCVLLRSSRRNTGRVILGIRKEYYWGVQGVCDRRKLKVSDSGGVVAGRHRGGEGSYDAVLPRIVWIYPCGDLDP